MFFPLYACRIAMTNPFRYLTVRESCSKLFVGGLCYDTNEPVLKNAFEKYGVVVQVSVICDHMTGKSKGYGFVEFHSEEAASSALASMNNQLLEGRNIRVEYAQPKGGLCYDTNEPVLKNAFEKYGVVVQVSVICDHMTGKSKGYGFVEFDSEEAASSALASMNNQLLEGRNIRVEYAQPKGGLY